MYCILRYVNYNKTFCKFCNNIKKHETDNITTLVYRILRKSCELDIVNENIVQKFGIYYKLKCFVLHDMQCDNISYLRKHAENQLSNSLVFLHKKKYIKFAINLLRMLKSTQSKTMVYINESYANFNEFFIKKMFEKYHLLEDWKRIIIFGYLYCSIQFTKNSSNNNNMNSMKELLDPTISIISYAHKKLIEDQQIDINTPRKYFNSIDYKYEHISILSKYVIDIELMLLDKFNHELFLVVISNDIIDYVITKAPTLQPEYLLKSFSLLYYWDSLQIGSEEKIDKLFTTLISLLNNQNNICLMSLKATFIMLKYNRIFLDRKKLTNFSVENLKKTNLYNENDLDNEIKLIDMLLDSLNYFRKFIDEFCSLGKTQQNVLQVN